MKTFERMTAAWEAHKASQPGGVFDTAARFRFTTKWVCAEFDRLREEMKPVHLSPHRWDCETCGPDVAVDEDGCCSMCGRHCNQYVDGKLVVKAEPDEEDEPAPVGADGGACNHCGHPDGKAHAAAHLFHCGPDCPCAAQKPQPTPAPEFRAGPPADAPLDRVYFEISNMPRHGLQWEWMSITEDGDYLDREAVLTLLNKHIQARDEAGKGAA